MGTASCALLILPQEGLEMWLPVQRKPYMDRNAPVGILHTKDREMKLVVVAHAFNPNPVEPVTSE